MRRSLPLLATLAVEVGAVALLYRFIKQPGFAIPIALGCATWMLSSTLLYLVARVTRVPAAISAAGRVTLPSLRRRVDRALAASILTGAVLAGGTPALAAAPVGPDPVVDASVVASDAEPETEGAPEPPSDAATGGTPDAPPDLPVRTGRVGDPAAIVEISTTSELPLEKTPEPTPPKAPEGVVDSKPNSTTRSTTGSASRPGRPIAPSAPASPATPSPAPTAAPTSTATTYTVVAGDNFWEIAARHLATETGRERGALSTDDVVRYWVSVCDANRDRVRSGDVNLIHPGELIDLPAV